MLFLPHYFCNMFKFIKKYYRKKLLKDAPGSIGSDFLNLKDIRTLGFVCELRSEREIDELCEVCKFLKSKGISFKALVFVVKKSVFPKGSAESEYVMPEVLMQDNVCVVMQDKLNWLGAFDVNAFRDFFDVKYDIIANFNAIESFSLKYAVANVNARMSVAMTDDGLKYTLLLGGSDGNVLGYREFANQIVNYLSVINKREK